MERTSRETAYLTRRDKVAIAVTTFALFCLELAALILVAWVLMP